MAVACGGDAFGARGAAAEMLGGGSSIGTCAVPHTIAGADRSSRPDADDQHTAQTTPSLSQDGPTQPPPSFNPANSLRFIGFRPQLNIPHA